MTFFMVVLKLKKIFFKKYNTIIINMIRSTRWRHTDNIVPNGREHTKTKVVGARIALRNIYSINPGILTSDYTDTFGVNVDWSVLNYGNYEQYIIVDDIFPNKPATDGIAYVVARLEWGEDGTYPHIQASFQSERPQDAQWWVKKIAIYWGFTCSGKNPTIPPSSGFMVTMVGNTKPDADRAKAYCGGFPDSPHKPYCDEIIYRTGTEVSFNPVGNPGMSNPELSSDIGTKGGSAGKRVLTSEEASRTVAARTAQQEEWMQYMRNLADEPDMDWPKFLRAGGTKMVHALQWGKAIWSTRARPHTQCEYAKAWKHQNEILIAFAENTSREILFVIDKKGNNGKSGLFEYGKTKGWCKQNATKSSALAMTFKEHLEQPNAKPILMLDMARGVDTKFIPWHMLESILDGQFTSVKYESALIRCPGARIIVTMNAFPPDIYQIFSQDRLKFIVLGDEENISIADLRGQGGPIVQSYPLNANIKYIAIDKSEHDWFEFNWSKMPRKINIDASVYINEGIAEQIALDEPIITDKPEERRVIARTDDPFINTQEATDIFSDIFSDD
jgi:hypothetical protein